MEKILVLPISDDNIIYPSDIVKGENTIITVWLNNNIVGFISFVEEWELHIGTTLLTSNLRLEDLIAERSEYIFKVNINN